MIIRLVFAGRSAWRIRAEAQVNCVVGYVGRHSQRLWIIFSASWQRLSFRASYQQTIPWDGLIRFKITALKCILFLWWKLYFQHHYSSLQCHMIFRNHYNILIYCSRNNSDYYQCLKQLWRIFCVFIICIFVLQSATENS